MNNNNNKRYALTLNNVLTYITLILFLFYFYDVFLSSTNFCDSGSVNDISDVNDNSQTRHLSELHFIDRFRRRVSWYINPLNKERFTSYSQFKSSWNPKTNLWSEVKIAIKEDLNKFSSDRANYSQQSRFENERIMSNIRNTRENSHRNYMRRYLDRINNKK